MKASKLREMSSEELRAQDDELTKQVFHLRFQLASGQMVSAKKLAPARRDLARVKTIQNERRRGQTSSAVSEKSR